MFNSKIIKSNKATNNRPLRIGNEIKQILTEIFFKSKIKDPLLFDKTIIITEVIVSKDFAVATVYVSPWIGISNDIIKVLNLNAGNFRHQIGKKLKVKVIPKLHFKLDNQFDNIDKVNALFAKIKPIKDNGTE